MDVDKGYVNEFGNKLFFRKDKSEESLSVHYNVGKQSSNYNTELFYIDNYETLFPKREELLDFFKALIFLFKPTHATITHDDIDDVIDFKVSEIWTGFITYVSSDVLDSFSDEFDCLQLDGLGNIVFSSNDNSLTLNDSLIDKVKELTFYLRSGNYLSNYITERNV